MHTTLIQQRKQEILTLEEEVIKILGWDYEQYCNYMYLQGLAYLANYFGTHNQTQINKFECSKLFWNWFKNKWALHNQVFVQDIKRLCITNGYNSANAVHVAIYKGLQNGVSLADDLIIDTQIFNDINKG